MLRDAEVGKLRADKKYKKLTQSGLRHFAADLITSGAGDFKPDVSFILRITYRIVKARKIRRELDTSGREILERLLNYELQWPRTPQSVRSICEAERSHYLWMRYDELRVRALFNHSHNLIMDANYRDLIKNYSCIEKDKNERLKELTREIEILFQETLSRMTMRDIYDRLIGVRAENFYQIHEKEIQDKFIDSTRGGALGLLPGDLDEEDVKGNVGDANNGQGVSGSVDAENAARRRT